VKIMLNAKAVLALALVASISSVMAECGVKPVIVATPKGFVEAYKAASGPQSIVESVPKGESVEKWTQMFTVSTMKGLAKDTSVTPSQLIEGIAAGFKAVCPKSFTLTKLKEEVAGGASQISYLRCGNGNPAGSPAYSESAVIAAIVSGSDVVTIQWAERSVPTFSPVIYEKANWQSRVDAIASARVCGK
jgi:hypothetical protein